ncbi:4283_t:CDS:2, partial [Racocetra persica]
VDQPLLPENMKVSLRNAQALHNLENGGQNRIQVEKDVHTAPDSDQALVLGSYRPSCCYQNEVNIEKYKFKTPI